MTRSEVLAIRQLIEQAVQSLPEAAALKGIRLHPAWVPGAGYAADIRVRFGGRLWRCLQAHTSQDGWEPGKAVSLWTEVCESYSGTTEDPIPYDGNMALMEGLYYVQDGVVYRCTRDTGAAVYQPLSSLVGLYVVEV